MTTPSVSDRQSPAFSFYPTDFLVGTATFSLEERGAYITLLSYQWDHGAVPDDATERARLLNCSLKRSDVLWVRLRTKFQHGSDGGWRNARLESERTKQAERRAALASNGSKGGRPRKANRNQTETNRFSGENQNESRGRENLTESLSSSSSFSSSVPTTPRTALSVARAVHPARRHGLQTLHRGGHQAHAWCSERICVPEFLHSKFVGAVGVGSDGPLRTFYAETVEAIPDHQPIESDPVKFWPPLVTARWPPLSASVGTRTAALQRATAEFLRGGQ